MKLKIVLLFSLLSLSVWGSGDSGDRNISQAEKLFSYFRNDQTDSLYDAMSITLKALVPKSQLEKQKFSDIEAAMGKYVSHTPWTLRTEKGLNIYLSFVQFERERTACVASFDNKGRYTAFQLAPASMFETDEQTPPSDVIERADTIITGDIRLPAKFCFPKGRTDAPVVVLVHGSGPNDMDEKILALHPFRDIAWQLAQRGISSLRYDKRTLVYPGKVPESVDEEVVNDALSAVGKAAEQSKQVYLLGHSLGGMLAPLTASKNKNIKGIILMAAPARTIEDVVKEQVTYLLSLQPAQNADPENAEKMTIGSIRQQSPYILGDLHQTDIAKSLKCKILVMQGERDYQVSMKDFNLWKESLKDNKNAEFRSYKLLNHLFTEGEEGKKSTPAEYNRKATVPMYVVEDIAGFINKK